ncbi:hypothetical protein B0H11DRAFT_2183074 [Mycena galericulata]|nr:hypothetical protein B0H11DRAFT_2183074 [Mycena galericulata]
MPAQSQIPIDPVLLAQSIDPQLIGQSAPWPSAFQGAAPKPPSRSPSPACTAADEQEELRAKISVLEAKRADDARYVRELETCLADAETRVSQLQAKLDSQHRAELIEMLNDTQPSEGRIVDAQKHCDQLEMTTASKVVVGLKRMRICDSADSDVPPAKHRVTSSPNAPTGKKKGKRGGKSERAKAERYARYLQQQEEV